MPSDGHQLPSSVSMSSAKSHSAQSSRANRSINTTVVTSPPWARDEPPSPKEREPQPVASSESIRHIPESHSFDITSDSSSIEDGSGPSRWWTFTRNRPSESLDPLAADTLRQAHTRIRRERALSIPWLNVSHYLRSQEEENPTTVRGDDIEDMQRTRSSLHDSPLHPNIPRRSDDPLTLAQNSTPGWDTPWTPRPHGDMMSRQHTLWGSNAEPPQADTHNDEKRGTWLARKKRFRAYLIHNAYVPLLFRFINIVLTTAALALAIRIRIIEKQHHVTGAIGSSPTLVIIFAPLTLVHVMIAIYSEYFGRPLGLWRTSGKLAYTLVEVVFICAWSAALALCFDNFFTSLIPCASPSSTSWYNELPRPTIPSLNSIEAGPGDTICDDQVALICLSGVGLMTYCFNLVISLFRIFERIKYHHAPTFPT